MAHIVLFHSILGLRDAEHEIAGHFIDNGHQVTLPDLFEGRSASNYPEGFALFKTFDRADLLSRAKSVVKAVPQNAVLSGVSFGAGIVSDLWSDRPHMKGALLFAGAAEWSSKMPSALPVSAHIAKPDPFDDEAYFDQWRQSAETTQLEVHRYDNVGHYFLDKALDDYNEAATKLCLDRSIEFLARINN